MRTTYKLELIDRIGRELQSRFRYEEIDAFLADFKVKPPSQVTANSKWVYSKTALRDAPPATLLRIAEELDMEVNAAGQGAVAPPKNWQNTKAFRLFISHISKHKKYASRLKECLEPYAIAGFVAHEDIHPTLPWQKEIERGLSTMDAFLAIHTEGFAKSVWTQQEIGFAVGRGVKIISFRMGEDPAGFISQSQALSRLGRKAEEIAKEVNGILSADERTNSRLVEAQNAFAPARTHDDDDEIPF